MRFYPEMEEVITSANKNGGRPMLLGHLLFAGSDQTDTQDIQEETSVRYHLGHCSSCGKRIVMGQKHALEFVKVLSKKGIEANRTKTPLRIKLAKVLLKGQKEPVAHCG